MPFSHPHAAACKVFSLKPVLFDVEGIAAPASVVTRAPLKNVLRRAVQFVSNSLEAALLGVAVSNEGSERLLRLVQTLVPEFTRANGFIVFQRIGFWLF